MAYVYFDDEAGRASVRNRMNKRQARLIAEAIAKIGAEKEE